MITAYPPCLAGAQAGDGCEAAGQYIPFAKTLADRLASGDPRLSVAERYPTFTAYNEAIKAAIDNLIGQRLMLCEDAASEQTRLMNAGIAAGVPMPSGGLPAPAVLPHCAVSHKVSR